MRTFMALSCCAILFCAGCAGGAVPGMLAFNSESAAPGEYPAGGFIVTWSGENGGEAIVTHREDREKVLWSSIPGRAFIAAGKGIETIREERGSFSIRDDLGTLCAEQTLDSISVEKNMVILKGTLSGKGASSSVGYRLEFRETGPNQLGFTLSLGDEAFNRTYLVYSSDADEQFFGFGEQFSFFNLKGKKLPIFVMEQGVGRGAQPITLAANLTAGSGGDWHTTYAGVPHYITSKLRSLFLENYEYVSFDMRDRDRVTIELFSPVMKGRILRGDSPVALIEAYTLYSGRMRPLPDWIMEGAVLGIQGGTDAVREIYKRLASRGVPIAALWLQDWVGNRTTSFGRQLWWNWTLDRERYPGWHTLVRDLGKKGVRVMIYVNPFLADVSERKRQGIRNLFREANMRGFLVKDGKGKPYMIKNTSFSAGLVDLTNPAARSWLKGVMRQEVIATGAMGWMADFGEALPMDAVLHSGESPSAYHNRYPEEWARLNREVIQETGRGSDYVFFSRSGYRRSPAYSTLFWLGDQLVTWDRHDGIKTAVTGLLSGGISGFSLNHSDIGGYTTITHRLKNYHRDRELIMRWMELNAFTTVFRSHEGNIPGANIQVYSDEETIAHFALCAKLYRAWKGYRKDLVRQAAETGLPVVRHPFIHYPGDREVWRLSYEQFMVGADLMVAPVLDPGEDIVNAYLPDGKWVHLWTGKVYDATGGGIRFSVPAPPGKPGVFFSMGSAAGRELVDNLKREGILL
ncbi:MAG: alpha-glucosidase [Spirochaetes bacterium]|nr:alpha-glucosidase [Spirochaetota bacterium]